MRRQTARFGGFHGRAFHGLGASLLVLAVFGMGSVALTRHITNESEAAVRLTERYNDARYAIEEELSAEFAYQLRPSPSARAEHRAAADLVVSALKDAEDAGSSGDRKLVSELLTLHETYLGWAGRLFAAVDAGDVALAATLDENEVDPRQEEIEERIHKAALAARQDGHARMNQLDRIQRAVVVGTPLVFATGALALGFLGFLLLRLNRSLEAEARLNEYRASHDSLTDLPNRRGLREALRQAITEAERESAPLAVLMLGLNRFKLINDTLGHSTGDEVLLHIGPRAATALKPVDTFARVSGDGFACVLPGVDRDGARATAERVLAALHEPFSVEEQKLAIDASIGIAVYPADGRDAETLFQRAEVAMFEAKSNKLDHTFYDVRTDPSDVRQLELRAGLRRALDADEIELHYQPLFEAATLRPVGVEALARWRHPDRGLIGPANFIPLAEDSGLMGEMTQFILRKAVRERHEHRDAWHDLPVSVNLSGTNLLDVDLVAKVASVLREAGAEPPSLVLELTETMMMMDPALATVVLSELAALGLRIAVDDFGTGHSALTYFRRFPVAQVKIDRSFIQNLTSDDTSEAIVASTIRLAHTLGIEIVAEGVEDAETLERLRTLECDLVQGFYLCRPQPVELLAGALGQHRPRRHQGSDSHRATDDVSAPTAAPAPIGAR